MGGAAARLTGAGLAARIDLRDEARAFVAFAAFVTFFLLFVLLLAARAGLLRRAADFFAARPFVFDRFVRADDFRFFAIGTTSRNVRPF